MAATLVGGAFLSASLQTLFGLLASREVVEFVRGKKLDSRLLSKLKVTLLSVNSVLSYAEDKQIIDSAVEEWLDELRDAVHDAEDMLDETNTDALQKKMEAEAESSSESLVRNFSCISLNAFDNELEHKIRVILERLEFIVRSKSVLGFKEGMKDGALRRSPTTSLVEESVYGRDEDKEAIIRLLLSNGDVCRNEICVIPVVGMGGIGKTTLAQLVYNDVRVQEYFDLRAWVCVSKEFDVVSITKTISETFTSVDCGINDLNLLQVKLKDQLMAKKFLIVLDDVWNEDYLDWAELRKPFMNGVNGSKVIVTTRSENVASIMGTIPSYSLKQLSDQDCWLLFAKHAFSNPESREQPNFQVMGREIVKKCKGLALAAKVLGGLLRSKQDPEDWNNILTSEIWDLSDDTRNILPALGLSYDYLPLHLKQCFSYCSIFPKGYKFRRDEVVLLWMAADLLPPPKGKKRMEHVGEECFHDLVSRSLFQQSGVDKSFFVMHDLVNDLAKCVSGKFCLRMDDVESDTLISKTRHLTFSRTMHDEKFKMFYDAKRLRTFLPLTCQSLHGQFHLSDKVTNDLLPRLPYLRALCLSHYNIMELPESIGNLKLLRYFDLSHTSIQRLPENVSTLYQLQTLILSCCSSLTGLPTSMRRLINLRHLDISHTKLKEMPRKMSKLKSLQTLTDFVVGETSECNIGELGELRNLRGKLSISKLQNVVHKDHASEAKMQEKKYLDMLVFSWAGHADDSHHERNVLERLQPHLSLKELTIENYGGTRFPDWLGDHSFTNMVTVHLEDCKGCFILPTLGTLPSLKELYISGFDGVRMVGSEFYGTCSSVNQPFRSLEILKFDGMSEWLGWSGFGGGDEGGAFPCLRELHLQRCPKLRGDLPNYLPSLTSVWIVECQQLVASLPRAPSIHGLKFGHCDMWQLKELPAELRWLRIEGCHVLESIPGNLKQATSCLQELFISNCSSLASFPRDSLPRTLKALEIEGCGQLDILSDCHYASLESLSIWRSCDSLESFPFDIFPKLNNLKIRSCKSLKSLSISGEPNHELQCLSLLEIWDCPSLVSFPDIGLPAPNLTQFKATDCMKLKWLPKGMNKLLSLQTLEISGCPELMSFPDGVLPLNLNCLYIWDCNKLIAQRLHWKLKALVSLKCLSIMGGKRSDVQCFPEEGMLPTSLTSLSICGFPNLTSLDKGLQQLTALEKLEISHCRKFQCLPKDGLKHLSYLCIRKCPMLKQCFRKEREDWPTVDHIPLVEIDNQRIS
ncbi:hypothetical protein ACFX2J_023522 [Malus domestica]|uniref:putative disease resistance RPP13-like protein 1 n=1 Tax=Malus domestica TaxID=3750 RepID=UPI00397706A2